MYALVQFPDPLAGSRPQSSLGMGEVGEEGVDSVCGYLVAVV